MVKIMENPIKMDDLGVPLFLEIPICIVWLPGGLFQGSVGFFLDWISLFWGHLET